MRHDPLNLFGTGFPDDYVEGFYNGLVHLAANMALVPASSVGGLAVRLRQYPNTPLDYTLQATPKQLETLRPFYPD